MKEKNSKISRSIDKMLLRSENQDFSSTEEIEMNGVKIANRFYF